MKACVPFCRFCPVSLDMKIKKKKKKEERDILLYIFLLTKDKTDKTDISPDGRACRSLSPIFSEDCVAICAAPEVITATSPSLLNSSLNKIDYLGKVPKLLPDNRRI